MIRTLQDIGDLVRPPDDVFYKELQNQHRRVWRFLPAVLEHIRFSSGPTEATLLAGLEYLASPYKCRKKCRFDGATRHGFLLKKLLFWLPFASERPSVQPIDRQSWSGGSCHKHSAPSPWASSSPWVAGNFQPIDSLRLTLIAYVLRGVIKTALSARNGR
jgi:hypothetical protein